MVSSTLHIRIYFDFFILVLSNFYTIFCHFLGPFLEALLACSTLSAVVFGLAQLLRPAEAGATSSTASCKMSDFFTTASMTCKWAIKSCDLVSLSVFPYYSCTGKLFSRMKAETMTNKFLSEQRVHRTDDLEDENHYAIWADIKRH